MNRISKGCIWLFVGSFMTLAQGVGLAKAQPAQFENVFTHFQNKMVDGRPFLDSFSGDFWDCMSVNLFGNTTNRSRVEAVFRGNDDVSESFFDAAKRCGFFYQAAPFQHSFSNDTVDLGLSISYSTPGITALPLLFGRPPGIETIADPSAVQLPDGRIALFFSGDHREAFQSTRWVTKYPITAHSQALEFELEQDYDLSERLLWRHLRRESDGSWTAFGNLNGFKKWTSVDGLQWQESSDVISFSPLPAEVRLSLNLSPNRLQFDAFISMERVGENEWIGVIPHYREGLDAESPDPNGNGYDDPPYVLIYSSTDGLTWTYESHIIGPAEGFVEKLDTNLYAFSLYGTVLFSSDLKDWGYGLEPHFTTRGIALDDGYSLTFGTRSSDGIPTYAHQVAFTSSEIPDFYLAPATYANLPTLNQINGTNVAVEPGFNDVLPEKHVITSIYPNPIGSNGLIEIRLEQPDHVQVDLFDMLGRKVRNLHDQYEVSGRVEISISTSELPSGPYLVVAKSKYGKSSTRIVIIH